MTQSDTLVRPGHETQHVVVTEHEFTTDKGKAAHIVLDPDRERDDVGAYLTEARVFGLPVTALCGWTWVPKESVKGKPVCQACKDIYEAEDRSDDSGSGLPDGD